MRTRADLARELDLLRGTAARGSGRKRVPLAELAKRSGVPRSTVHTYLTGQSLPPADVLDRLVIALGGTPADQPDWADAWDRVAAHEHGTRRTRPADPPPTVPRQLPAAPSSFIGRQAELDLLDAGGGTAIISAIAGTGGLGKTWLALHWAHTHAERFPDGQLFVDLRGFSPGGEPMPPGVALRGFLEALGVAPAHAPADPHAQSALYRSLLAGKRMLVVLDNAAGTEQVVPLLPGTASCTVLVTSRRQLTGLVTAHGARPVHLDVLADAEARRLLAGRLGAGRVAAEPDAVDTLLAVCGGFALALAIVAAHAGPGRSLATLAAGLRDTATRFDVLDSNDPTASLSAVLSWSLRALSHRQREVFALLGIAPGPDIGPVAAARLAGLSRGEIDRALGALVEASLLEEDDHGRYRMHDLVRAYATSVAEELPERTRDDALGRVVDHYLHTARAADALLEPHREPLRLDPPAPSAPPRPLPDYAAAMAWFDAEHACLLAAQLTAVAHGRHAAVWHLAWNLDTFHHRRGHRHDRLAVWRSAADAAPHLPGSSGIAQRFLGRAHTVLGQHDEALHHLNRALDAAEDDHETAHAHFMLARAWAQREDLQRALSHARSALVRYRGLPEREARALNEVGWYAAQLGDHETAREHGQAALTAFQSRNDVSGEAATRFTLGYVEHHDGHHTQAVEHYHLALELCRELHNTQAEADSLHGLGHPLAALGEIEEARAAWEEALRLYREQGHSTGAARVRRLLDEQRDPA
ncbi:MAG: hypothetical protein QOI78_8326 [Actinomycetota bacterium]|nr:hypothetical protein [Actinomycetota bacterium]